jgi:Na+/H+ antiporter NhaC
MSNRPQKGAPLSDKIAGGISIATLLASITGASLLEKVPNNFAYMLPVLILALLSFLMMLYVSTKDWQPGVNDDSVGDEV